MKQTIVLSAFVVVWIAAAVAAQRPTPPAFTSENIDKAVEKARGHIGKLQKPDGSWPGIIGHEGHPHLRNIYPSGNTALALIALNDSGVSVRNPAWRKGAAYLTEQDDRGVYGRVLKIIALSIGARIERARYLPELGRDVRALLKGMRPDGGWRYRLDYHKLKDEHAHSTDNSCSQYVALALREAIYAGAEVPRKLWERLEKYWRIKQCIDGGFDVSRPEVRRALRIEGFRGRTPQWQLYRLDGRTAVVASPHDIASGIQGQRPWNCRGYAIESARRIGVNLVLLAAGEEVRR